METLERKYFDAIMQLISCIINLNIGEIMEILKKKLLSPLGDC